MTNRVKASDTPETDAAIAEASDPDGALEVCDLCERLERERDEEREESGTLFCRVNVLKDELADVAKERDQWRELADRMAAILTDAEQSNELGVFNGAAWAETYTDYDILKQTTLPSPAPKQQPHGGAGQPVAGGGEFSKP